MFHNQTLYLSRSAIEAYQACRRYYWYNYHACGTGIIPTKPIRYFEIGIALHRAMEILLTGGTPEECYKLTGDYLVKVFRAWMETEGDVWTLKRDIAMVYGWTNLYRRNHLKEREVVCLEEDISTVLNGGGWDNIVFESKADYVWKDGEGQVTLENFKTSKNSPNDDSRVDKGYKHDLQGITESMALKQVKGLSVTDVQYTFFVKGWEREQQTQEGNRTGKIELDNPLTIGYHTRSGGEFRYAHSNLTIKQENISGYGRLGKNWEKFDTWDNPKLGDTIKERIDTWIDMVYDGIQAELPNPLDAITVQTAPKYRNEQDSILTMDEITWDAKEIYSIVKDRDIPEDRQAPRFRRTRSHCTYPVECPYKDFCFRGLAPEDLLKAGAFKRRVPHHELERKAAEEYLVQIGEGPKEKKDPFLRY